jgi:hypothetical protein
MASWDDLKVGAQVLGTARGTKEQTHVETLSVSK